MTGIELSIVITAHDEGLLLHKTLNSVFCATDELDKNDISYEVIVHIDKGDAETIEIAKKYSSIRKIRILKNSFGSLSQSRNYAVSAANGEYVAFLDGDDYISKNWYLNAIHVLKGRREDCVIYPEALLTFYDNDNRHGLCLLKEYTGDDEDLLTIISGNCWTSVVMSKKKVFLETPYLLMNEGYCYEDWAFNVQTLKKGVSHLIAPGTTMFYRQRSNSMLMQANDDGLVLPRMSLYDLKEIKRRFLKVSFYEDEDNDLDDVAEKNEDELVETKKSFRDNTLYKKVRGNWYLNYLVTPFLRLALNVRSRCKKDADSESGGDLEQEPQDDALDYEKINWIPDFILGSWREMNKNDIQLYPTYGDLINTTFFDIRNSIDIGKSYASLSKSFTRLPDYVFILPWIVKGGAEKVMLNYIKAIHEIHPDWHFALITTLNKKRTWLDRFPKYVDLYELGLYTPYLSRDGAEVLITRLLTQLGCKKIHIINSELGYRWVRNHSSLVKAEYTVNISIFNEAEVEEWDGEKKIYSYESPGLFEIFTNTNKVFSDNEHYLNLIGDRNGFNKDKLIVHYQPVDLTLRKQKPSKKQMKKILWAGRIAPIKMPEIVVKIGGLLEDVHIDMYGAIDNDVYSEEELFKEATNVSYCGEFSEFDKLPVDDYDLFLYTAENDGLPNTILEAAAAGLPIIASNDGGVGEFIIHKKTGILIKNYYEPDGYVKAIEDVYKGKYDLEKMVLNAQKLLKERHNWKRFVELVRKDIG